MRIKTEAPISLGFIKQTLGIKAEFNEYSIYASAICTDSRELCGGELFIGLRGEGQDGSLFIKDAKRLALCTVGTPSSDADIKVADTGSALLSLSNAYKKLLSVKRTVAITGSVGKTTTKDLAANILRCKYKVHSTYKNLNNEIGVPLTVFGAPADTEILIIEAGMNHTGELDRISRSIEPDIAVITKIGSAHIGNLGSREKIADAKLEILCGMKEKFALIPYGETLLTNKIQSFRSVSTSDKRADYVLFKDSENGYTFKSGSKCFDIYPNGIEKANFHVKECLAFALAISEEIGMDESEITNAVNSIDFCKFSNRISIDGLEIINDSYNSSPEAAKAALIALRSEKGKKSALIGDMLELGDLGKKLHFEVGALAAECRLDKLYLIGDFSKDMYNGAVSGGFDKNRIFINEDAQAPEITADQIIRHSSSEVILFKASRKIRLERIINILKKAQNDR